MSMSIDLTDPHEVGIAVLHALTSNPQGFSDLTRRTIQSVAYADALVAALKGWCARARDLGLRPELSIHGQLFPRHLEDGAGESARAERQHNDALRALILAALEGGDSPALWASIVMAEFFISGTICAEFKVFADGQMGLTIGGSAMEFHPIGDLYGERGDPHFLLADLEREYQIFNPRQETTG